MMEDKVIKSIITLLKKDNRGITITDLVKKTGFSRSTIIQRLALLQGAKKLIIRQVSGAKLHYLKKNKND